MTSPSDIKQWISQNLEAEYIAVEGDGHHFEATVVCACFEGRSTLQRHRLVYAALGDKMKAAIHALSLHTLTPAEYQSK